MVIVLNFFSLTARLRQLHRLYQNADLFRSVRFS